MELTGTQTIAAPLEKVWAFLLDVNNVAGCAPGFKSLKVLGTEHWEAVVGVAVGPIKATITMDVTRPQMKELDSMVVKMRGKAPGSMVDGTADMRLKKMGDNETRMIWTANVDVSGAIASVGARLMQGTIERQATQFFDCFKTKLQKP